MDCYVSVEKSDRTRIEIYYEEEIRYITVSIARSETAFKPEMINDFMQILKPDLIRGIREVKYSDSISVAMQTTFNILCKRHQSPMLSGRDAIDIPAIDLAHDDPTQGMARRYIPDSVVPQRFTIDERTSRIIEELEDEDLPANALHVEEASPPPHAIPLASVYETNNALLRGLASVINRAVINNHMKPPNFHDRSKKGIRKIKNFIHNITKIWLNVKEVYLFLDEYNKLML